jgi:hypothetical protein
VSDLLVYLAIATFNEFDKALACLRSSPKTSAYDKPWPKVAKKNVPHWARFVSIQSASQTSRLHLNQA